MKQFVGILVVVAVIVVFSGKASALCPDKINCLKHDKTIGHVLYYVPTCYKLFKGCRPWHCKDSDFVNTDQHYWEHRCAEFIAEICEDAYGRILCAVEYPLH